MTDDCDYRFYSPHLESSDFVFIVSESCGPELTGNMWRVRVRIPACTHNRLAYVSIDGDKKCRRVEISSGETPDTVWARGIAAKVVRDWRTENA